MNLVSDLLIFLGATLINSVFYLVFAVGILRRTLTATEKTAVALSALFMGAPAAAIELTLLKLAGK